MIANGVQVIIRDVYGDEYFLEINETKTTDGKKCFIEVLPGETFRVQIKLLSNFQLERKRHTYVRYDIDRSTADFNNILTIVKPDTQWSASRGVFHFGHYDVSLGVDFAFGRNMDDAPAVGEHNEKFKDRGTVSVSVGRNDTMWTQFDFEYATREVLLKEGVLKEKPALPPSDKPTEGEKKPKDAPKPEATTSQIQQDGAVSRQPYVGVSKWLALASKPSRKPDDQAEK